MSRNELIIRIIAKVLLIIGLFIIFLAGCTIEKCGPASAIKPVIIGCLICLPDLLLFWLDGIALKDKE